MDTERLKKNLEVKLDHWLWSSDTYGAVSESSSGSGGFREEKKHELTGRGRRLNPLSKEVIKTMLLRLL